MHVTRVTMKDDRVLEGALRAPSAAMLLSAALVVACSGNDDPGPGGDDSTADDSAAPTDDSSSDDSGQIDADTDGWPPPADCDDANPAIHPEAAESCANGTDDDCDGEIDGCDLPIEGNVAHRFYNPTADERGSGGFGTRLGFLKGVSGSTLWVSPQGFDEDVWRGATVDAWPAATRSFGDDAVYDFPLLSTKGDYDGDGAADLVIGSRTVDADPLVQAAIFSSPVLGGDDTIADAIAFIVAPFEKSDDYGAPEVFDVGDVTVDGFDDLLFVAVSDAWVIPGPVSGSIVLTHASDLVSGAGVIAAAGGDLDGDGVPDVVLGNASPSGGSAYVFLGPVTTSLEPDAADGSWNATHPYDNFGVTMAAGDFDGDGLADVVAQDEGGDDDRAPGALHLMSGVASANGTVDALASATLTGDPGDHLGEWSLDVADFDRDGLADLAAPALQSYTVSEGGGYVAIVLGPLAGNVRVEDVASLLLRGQPDDIAGMTVATGDFDGDGEVELSIMSGLWVDDGYVAVVDVLTPAFVLAP